MGKSEIETRLFINNEVAGPEDINIAVNAARAAFKTGPWSKYTGAGRSACMLKFASLVEQNMEELARLETLAMGKPLSVLLHLEIPSMIACYRYYAGWADKIEGESFNADDGVYKIVRHEPLGVCAGIASWNATFFYAAWKIAPAIAARNTFIFKASEKAPLAILAMARFFVEAGFPPGVVQFVSGGPKTGQYLSSHMHIAKISITGSIGAGVKVQDQATKSNLKKVVLEFGGKSPAIVFNDAEINSALSNCSHGFLFNSGQICAASSRLYVQEEIAPKFIEALKTEFQKAAVGLGADPMEASTTLGPLADKTQMDRVIGFIEAGKNSAELLTGGVRKGEKGCFVEPTIFFKPAKDSTVYKDEIFGPVLVVNTFKTEEEVVELANDSCYGLAACVYTKNLDCALRMSASLESGGVSISGPFLPSNQTPFGGFKQSGLGKELGKYGLQEYMKTKTIHIK